MLSKRWRAILPLVLVFLIVLALLPSSKSSISNLTSWPSPNARPSPAQQIHVTHDSFWAKLNIDYPVTDYVRVPTPRPQAIPRIQANFDQESFESKAVRLQRLEAVKSNFTHAWFGYKQHAWLHDEVLPLSSRAHDPFGGWAATLVDSLDTLWIMGLEDELGEAVKAIDSIDFSQCSLGEINVFETTIRYLGGFLAAYDLSDGKFPTLLQKAVDLGDMLYKAFDTPNRMPITRWDFRAASSGKKQESSDWMLVAEIASLSLEFTRLSQITGDAKWFDAVQRIANHMHEQQSRTRLPGMWPVVVDAKAADFTKGDSFTIGGMADSAFEYLPKQHLLLAAGTTQYQEMYEAALSAMKKKIFFRAMTPDNTRIAYAGKTSVDSGQDERTITTEPEAQHLGCFAGGMVGLGAKLFQSQDDLTLARQLVEGCLWAYENMPNGMMSEIMHVVPCQDDADCSWDEAKWLAAVKKFHGDAPQDLPKGVCKVDDKRYILRPEAIESTFILYRLTGDRSLQDRAWRMFESIVAATQTETAHAALSDCMSSPPIKEDRMESFWMAETLKYFYLIFSEPDIVSLDKFVLNTEAHPLRRPQ